MTTQHESIDLETLFASKASNFVLRVRGDSMIDAHILDGDYVVCAARGTAVDGERAVVVLADENMATLRIYRREPDGRVRLERSNASMPPEVFDADKVLVKGVVVGVLRNCR